jgi:hypothetical protein
MKKLRLRRVFLLLALAGLAACKHECDPINTDLAGRWERADGNNTPFNGMIVEFGGTQGLLQTVPATAAGFSVGDAKWRNVQKEKDGVYGLEDRDAGGGYVRSRILILSDGQELMLSGQTSNAGFYQKWKRL